MTCVEKIGHEECGSSDALQIFQENGQYNGYCFSCDTYIPDPYRDKPEGYRPEPSRKPPDEQVAEIQEIASYPYMALPERSLGATELSYFGVRCALSERDGTTPVAVYFPYTGAMGDVVGYKVRLLSQKKMWSMGDIKGGELFGWRQALATGAKTLFITEGEYDAIALYQALKQKNAGTKWADYDPAVVSLKNGASGAGSEVAENLAQIRANFREVVLVYDQDEAGDKAVRATVDVLPTARRCGTLPAKDANQCLLDGFSKGLVAAVMWKSEIPKNTHLVDLTSLIPQARVPPEMGLSWPWEGMTKLTRGIRFGETVYFGAGVKMGKSELVDILATHLIMKHGLKVMLAKPEEANIKTMKLLLGKVAGKIFHDPDVEFDYEAYDEAARRFPSGSVLGINLYQHLGWESLRGEIMVAHQAGCRAVFIDPISNLVNGVAASETNTKLQEIAQELAALARDLDMIVFIFCHLKAPESGDSHERGGKVLSSQFSGSRAMMRSCHQMWGLEGNKDPDIDEIDRNTRRLILLEDREYGASGLVKLFRDPKTGLFNEFK